MSDPAPVSRAARRGAEMLAEDGVELAGTVRLEPELRNTNRRVLAEFRSSPLSEVLDRVLTDSHNWTADMLVLTLGWEVARTGRFDDGVAVITDILADEDTKAAAERLKDTLMMSWSAKMNQVDDGHGDD